MESLQHISMRLKAVKNVGKITKAMEVVSATKMRKSQEIALRTRPYSQAALELLHMLGAQANLSSIFMHEREVRREAVILISSDRGLAGSFNAQVFRAFEQFLSLRASLLPIDIIAVGKKAVKYAEKRGYDPLESYSGFGDFIDIEEIEPLIQRIVRGYVSGTWDRIYTVSMYFRTTLRQDPLVRVLLPATQLSLEKTLRDVVPEYGRYAQDQSHDSDNVTTHRGTYLLEPSSGALVDVLVPSLIRSEIYQIILEANASEHSARRVAMKTASDNAEELADTLALTYNKARQAGITKEIIEITSTQTALSG